MSASAAEPFGPVQRIVAGVLDVGYVDVGPPGGRAALLLHGWPYDIHSYAEVAPPLAAAGYRVLVPYLRGYSATRFRSDHTTGNGQQSVLAVDAIALMDALGVDEAIVAGFDWGAQLADDRGHLPAGAAARDHNRGRGHGPDLPTQATQCKHCRCGRMTRREPMVG